MSTKNYVLTLSPPFDGRDTEVFKIDGLTCCSCNGKGTVVIYEDYLQIADPETEECMRCHGSGKLIANIEIKWIAAECVIE